MKLRRTARSDVGKMRDHNEDAYGEGEGAIAERLGELLIVCDGMGGHAAGEVASQLAVDRICAAYYADTADDRPAALEAAFVAANHEVHRQGRGTMGTTGVAALLYHNALLIANVGDSRAYLLRADTIRQISRDHSFVADQIEAGLLTPEQARMSAHRNIITRAIGHQSDVTVDLFRWPLQVGDIVLLCSDGLHGLVSDEEMLQLVREQPFDQIADLLVDLANERGGNDNITVIAAIVDALDEPVQTGENTVDTAPLEATNTAQPVTERLVVPVASLPAPRRTVSERRLSLLGGILSLLLLLSLLSVIGFVALNPPTASAPLISATSMPTAQPTSGGTSVPTAAGGK